MYSKKEKIHPGILPQPLFVAKSYHSILQVVLYQLLCISSATKQDLHVLIGYSVRLQTALGSQTVQWSLKSCIGWCLEGFLIGGEQLSVTHEFHYVDIVLTYGLSISEGVIFCTSKANATFGKLSEWVWRWQGIKVPMKIKLWFLFCFMVVKSAGYRQQSEQLEKVHQSFLRSLLRNKWFDWFITVLICCNKPVGAAWKHW